MDNRTIEERSKNMAAIKNRDTSPELFLRHALFLRGYRYRLHSSSVPGHPDIWMRKFNTAIFVHGCFWHRHAGCKYASVPKSRTEFWISKFERNVRRDDAVKKELERRHIKCLVIWECTIKNARKKSGNPDTLIDSIEEFLNSDEGYAEL